MCKMSFSTALLKSANSKSNPGRQDDAEANRRVDVRGSAALAFGPVLLYPRLMERLFMLTSVVFLNCCALSERNQQEVSESLLIF